MGFFTIFIAIVEVILFLLVLLCMIVEFILLFSNNDTDY